MLLLFFFSQRFLFPLDPLVRLKEPLCSPLSSLRIWSPTSPHWRDTPLLPPAAWAWTQGRDSWEMSGKKTKFVEDGSGSFNHMSRGDIWHLSPFQLDSSSGCQAVPWQDNPALLQSPPRAASASLPLFLLFHSFCQLCAHKKISIIKYHIQQLLQFWSFYGHKSSTTVFSILKLFQLCLSFLLSRSCIPLVLLL